MTGGSQIAGSNDKLYFVDVNDDKNLLLGLDIQVQVEDVQSVVVFLDSNRGHMFRGMKMFVSV